jgi:rhodanese-related sulfurtransferase
MFNLFRTQPVGGVMTASEAHEAQKKGEIILVDVRTPNEWAKTGIGEGVHAISAADPNFLARLEELAAGDKSRKIGFICATGARSGQVAQILRQYGWENVVNVHDGMMGNRTAPGWIRSGLPVVPWRG